MKASSTDKPCYKNCDLTSRSRDIFLEKGWTLESKSEICAGRSQHSNGNYPLFAGKINKK